MVGISEKNLRETNLPLRTFFYTFDQIGTMLGVTDTEVVNRWVFFDQRSPGKQQTHQLMARNIAPEDAVPDWRVADRELIRWLRRMGWRITERQFLQR